MISNYRGKPLEPSIGMFFSIPIAIIELRKDCYLKNGLFYAMLKHKGNTIALGAFEDAAECNLAYDIGKVERKRGERLINCQGYTYSTSSKNIKVSLIMNGKMTYGASFEPGQEVEAKKLHKEMFNQETARQISQLKKEYEDAR